MKKNVIDLSLCLVTDSKRIINNTLEKAVEESIVGGCTAVQLREKEATDREFYERALRIKRLTQHYHIPLIINDRLDIALAAGAEGVHVGQSDMPAEVARKLIGSDRILGVSVSNLTDAQKAVEAGADYLGVGAMFETDSKADAKRVEMKELIDIIKGVDVPVIVIGGVNDATISAFADVNIAGVAVISAILSSPNIREATGRIKEKYLEGRKNVNRRTIKK